MTTSTGPEEKVNTVKAVIFVAVFFGLALVVFFFGSNKDQVNKQPDQPTQHINTIAEFNKTDKAIETNGNVPVAMTKIIGVNGTNHDSPVKITSTELTKSPYSSLGKLIKIKGQVFKVEELQRNPDIPGRWAEILLLAPNKNSATQVSTISYIYDGDISTINSGDVITCSGFFSGTYQSQNAMGGAVEGLSVVGNKILHE